MSRIKTNESDVTSDYEIEAQSFTLSGGSDTDMTWSENFADTSYFVSVTPAAENTVSHSSKTVSGVTITTAASSNTDVDVLVIGKT